MKIFKTILYGLVILNLLFVLILVPTGAMEINPVLYCIMALGYLIIISSEIVRIWI